MCDTHPVKACTTSIRKARKHKNRDRDQYVSAKIERINENVWRVTRQLVIAIPTPTGAAAFVIQSNLSKSRRTLLILRARSSSAPYDFHNTRNVGGVRDRQHVTSIKLMIVRQKRNSTLKILFSNRNRKNSINKKSMRGMESHIKQNNHIKRMVGKIQDAISKSHRNNSPEMCLPVLCNVCVLYI